MREHYPAIMKTVAQAPEGIRGGRLIGPPESRQGFRTWRLSQPSGEGLRDQHDSGP